MILERQIEILNNEQILLFLWWFLDFFNVVGVLDRGGQFWWDRDRDAPFVTRHGGVITWDEHKSNFDWIFAIFIKTIKILRPLVVKFCFNDRKADPRSNVCPCCTWTWAGNRKWAGDGASTSRYYDSERPSLGEQQSARRNAKSATSWMPPVGFVIYRFVLVKFNVSYVTFSFSK